MAAAHRSTRPLPIDVTVAIVRDLLEGLHAAHETKSADGLSLDIIHRDVSPHNVLVGIDGVARVTDFGIAKSAWRREVTEMGAIKGKLAYMAPELLEAVVDRRSDLYGAGVVLWELLTGRRFRNVGSGGAAILVEILRGVPTAPSAHAPEAAVLDGVVLRALTRDLDARFATAHEMSEAIVSSVEPASAARVAAVVAAVLGSESKRAEQPGFDARRWTSDVEHPCGDRRNDAHAQCDVGDEVTLTHVVDVGRVALRRASELVEIASCRLSRKREDREHGRRRDRHAGERKHRPGDRPLRACSGGSLRPIGRRLVADRRIMARGLLHHDRDNAPALALRRDDVAFDSHVAFALELHLVRPDVERDRLRVQ
jgi:hypothetical protein